MCSNQLTLNALLQRVARSRPEGYLTIYGRRRQSRSKTYAKLHDDEQRFAAGIRAMGGRRGEFVGLAFSASIEFFIVFFGSLRAGLVVVPLPTGVLGRLRSPREQERTQSILKIVKPRWIFGPPEVGGNVSVDEIFASGSSHEPLAPLNPEDIAVVQFTSGSLSEPKGVVLTQANLGANVMAIAEAVNMGPADTVDHWLPLFHDMGIIGTLAGLCSGADVRLCSPGTFLADPFGWLCEFAKNRSTISPAPHFAYRMLTDSYDCGRASGLNLSTWRVAFNGSEPISFEDLERFQSVFGPHGFRPSSMVPVYGLAEATLAVTFPKYGTAPQSTSFMNGIRYVSVGTSITGQEVMLRTLPPDLSAEFPKSAGEICIRGASLMQGYLLSTDLIDPCRDALGWFATGDVGFSFEGRLHVCGRIKELIIIRGQHYFPRELEWAALQSARLKGVKIAECAALGVDDKGEAFISIFVEIRDSPPDLLERLQAVGGELTRDFGVVIRLIAVPTKSIPKTTSGKIRRLALPDLFRKQNNDQN
jgi:fatty-acyl-CoA synthase